MQCYSSRIQSRDLYSNSRFGRYTRYNCEISRQIGSLGRCVLACDVIISCTPTAVTCFCVNPTFAQQHKENREEEEKVEEEDDDEQEEEEKCIRINNKHT